jgi:hypothetical protein
MSVRLEGLASDKEVLLMRSALCRLRLRHATHDLRESLHWKRAAAAAVAAPSLRRVAFGVALSVVGLGRSGRMLLLAGRILLLAKLASSIIGRARRGAMPSPRNAG